MRFNKFLIWAATAIVAVCSCTTPMQELSSYWDGYDFTSLDAFDDIDAAEDKFDGYINLLSRVRTDKAVDNLTEFLDSASQNVVAYMVWSSWFEPYFHALESPYRNDELFVAWLDKVLEDKVIDDGAQMKHLQTMRQIMDKNTVGSHPEDILLNAENDAEFMLSDLYGKRMLVLFVDANCPSCLSALEANTQKYQGKDVRLLAILVNGTELHLSNVRRQLSEDVLGPWTITWCSAATMENKGFYDKSLLPFRMLISKDGIIEKSYH